MRQVTVLLILLLSSLSIPQSAAAQNDGPVTAETVSHGVRVFLFIPRRVYPRDALVQFTVTLQNVSHQDRYLQDWPPDWGGPYSPHILMRTARGRLVYEEALSSFLAPTPGTLADNYVLHPGATLTRLVRFVLQAPQVQAVEKVFDGHPAEGLGHTSFSARAGTPTPPGSRWAQHQWRITTPFVPLTLTDEPAPAVSVSRSRGRVQVLVRPAGPVAGPPYFMDSIRCWTGPSTMWVNQHVDWTAAWDNRFSSPIDQHCPSRQPWHAVIGWPDHRVAFISYVNVPQVP